MHLSLLKKHLLVLNQREVPHRGTYLSSPSNVPFISEKPTKW